MTIPEQIYIMQSFSSGKQIEKNNKDTFPPVWKFDPMPTWNFDKYEYRIRNKEAKSYNITTLKEAINTHGTWFRFIEDENSVYSIIQYNSNGVGFVDCENCEFYFYSYEDLVNEGIWNDDSSPMGIDIEL